MQFGFKQKLKQLFYFATTVLSCVIIIVFGITSFSRSAIVTTTIGDNITTNDLIVSGNATTTASHYIGGNLEVDGSTKFNNISYTWPATDGSSGQALTTNSLGSLSWTTITGGSGANNYGVAGSLAFYSSSGTTATGTASALLYWDNTNARLGIGTTSPYAKLSVAGQTVAEYFTATSTSATSTFPYLASTQSNLGTVVGGTWQGTSIGVAYGGTGLTSITQGQTLYASADNTLAATSTLYISSNGKIGIGTTSPANNLNIDGGAGAAFIGLDSAADLQTGILLKSNNDIEWRLLNKASLNIFAIRDHTAGSDRLVIDALGNVGIGTTSPYAKLSVVGQTVAEYFTATSTSATSTFPYLASTRIAITGLTGGSVPFIDGGGIISQDNNNLYWDDVNNRLGIGTASPANSLHVLSATVPQFRISNDATNYLTASVLSDGGAVFSLNGSIGGLMITNPQPAAVSVLSGTTATTSLRVMGAAGGNTTRNTSGIGGIGGGLIFTAGAGGTADLALTSDQGGLGGAINITSGTGGQAAAPEGLTKIGGFGGDLNLSAGAGGASFNAGNINYGGIGGSVVIVGGSGANASGGTNNYGGTGGSVYISGGGAGTGSSANGSAGDLYLGYNGSSILGNVYFGISNAAFISSTGNFGIGTSSPYAKLSVVGQTVSTYFTATSTTATSTFSTGGLAIGTSQFIVQQSSGNVGIGTASPGAPLTVTKSFAVNGEWKDAAQINATMTGSSGDYSGIAGLNISSTASTIGDAGEAYGLIASSHSSNDGAIQTVYGVQGALETHANDVGYAFYASSIYGGASTGGTQYGLYINMDDADATRYGVYQATVNDNYFAGNVGIGTTTPWGKFSITNTGAGPSFIVEDDTSPDSTPFVIDASGQVGIGMTSMLDKLHIASDYSSNQNVGIRFSDSGNNWPGWRMGIKSDSGGVPRFFIGLGGDAIGTDRFTMDTAGNLGIGTTSPYAKLSVVGETVSTYFTATSITATSTFPYLASTQSNLGTVVGGIWQGTTIGVAYGGTGLTSISAGQILVASAANTLQATSTIYLQSDGMVGIGTTTPTARFYVEQQTNDTSVFVVGDAGTSTPALKIDGAGITEINRLQTGIMKFEDDAGTVSWINLPITSASANTQESYSAMIDDNAVLTVYAESDGSGGAQNTRVGIGTTSPYAKLSVVGETVSSYFTATSTTATSTFSTGGLAIGTSQFIVQQNSGNVGIGTANPGYDLDFVGTNGMIRLRDVETDATNKAGRMVVGHYTNSELPLYVFGAASTATANYLGFGGGSSLANASTQIDFSTAANTTTPTGTSRMTINSIGRIGIGDTTPDALLDISSSTASVLFRVDDSGDGDTSPFIIDGDGLVGIGTTSPGALFAVQGNALADAWLTYEVAEMNLFPEDENEYFEQGDLLAISDEGGGFVKANSANNYPIIGVAKDVNIWNSSSTKPAILGTFNLKVSTENGDIYVGDYLTKSSVDGVAMRANPGDQTVGFALELYSSSAPGIIKIFITLDRNSGGEIEASSSDNSSSAGIFGIVDGFQWILDEFKLLGVTIKDGLVKAKQFIADKITTKELCVEDVCINRNQLEELLKNININSGPPAESDSGAGTPTE